MNDLIQKFNTLSVKMIINISSLFLLICLFNILYFPEKMKNKMKSDEIQKAEIIGTLISSSIAPAIYFNDNETIKNEVNNLYNLKNIVFVLITDSHDSLIYSNSYNISKSLNYKFTNKNDFITDTILYSITRIYLKNKYLGKIHMAYSLSEQMKSGINQSIIFMSITVFIFVIGILLSLIISKIITRQLNSIIRTAHSVKSGNFSKRVKIITNDEIGFLAGKFNEMLDNIEELYTNLENKVNERTKELKETNYLLEKEIMIKDNTTLKLQNSLQEKEILLKEIHHRVKNNLQVISSLLYLQSSKILEKEYKEIFNESQNRIKSMALVHEKLYKSVDLSGVELSDYIHSLISYLFKSYNVNYHKIKQEIQIDNIILSIDKSMPFGLIINELVTNSLKYAYEGREDGILRISIIKGMDEIIKVSVFDDGIGIPEDFDIKNSTSLGLRLVQTLVSQLEGTLHIVSNHGTEFIFEFSETKKNEKLL